MNTRLLRRVQRQILAEPKRLDMLKLLMRGREAVKCYGKDMLPLCGTVGCIAGWTVELGKGHRAKASITAAAKLLRLTDEQANRLFFFAFHCSRSYWPANFEAAYDTATTDEARAQITSDRIDHFIRTKGAE